MSTQKTNSNKNRANKRSQNESTTKKATPRDNSRYSKTSPKSSKKQLATRSNTKLDQTSKERISKIKEILSPWQHGLVITQKTFDSYILSYLSSGKYRNGLKKTPAQNTIDTLTVRQLIQLRSYASLESKIKDVIPQKSEAEMISELDGIQSEIETVERDSIEKLKPFFTKRSAINFDDYDPTLNEDLPYIVTAGTSFPAKVYPNMPGCPPALKYLLEVIDDGLEKVEDPIYQAKKLEAFNKRGGLFACKFTVVPKNWKTGRGIGIPSREAIAYTALANTALRKKIIALNNKRSLVSFARQSIQQNRILEYNTSSVDLSSASDRVSLALIESLDPSLGSFIRETTPHFVTTKTGDVNIKCCGLQGYPLVFTTMALLVAAIAECYTSDDTICSNYGDDLIINSDYEQVKAALRIFGLVVNTEKSYDTEESNFTESCGVDSLRDVYIPVKRDITPVYLRNTDDASIISFINQAISKDLLSKQQIIRLANLTNCYYIYPYSYNTSSFHINYEYEENKIIYKGKAPKITQKYQAPYMVAYDLVDSIDTVYGFNRHDSEIILSVIAMWEDIKNNGVTYLKEVDDGNYERVNHAENPLYYFIQVCDGLYEIQPNADLIDLYFESLKCDIYRILALLKVYMGYGYLFKSGSHGSHNSADMDPIVEIKHMITNTLGINTPYAVSLGRHKAKKALVTIPIPFGFSL